MGRSSFLMWTSNNHLSAAPPADLAQGSSERIAVRAAAITLEIRKRTSISFPDRVVRDFFQGGDASEDKIRAAAAEANRSLTPRENIKLRAGQAKQIQSAIRAGFTRSCRDEGIGASYLLGQHSAAHEAKWAVDRLREVVFRHPDWHYKVVQEAIVPGNFPVDPNQLTKLGLFQDLESLKRVARVGCTPNERNFLAKIYDQELANSVRNDSFTVTPEVLQLAAVQSAEMTNASITHFGYWDQVFFSGLADVMLQLKHPVKLVGEKAPFDSALLNIQAFAAMAVSNILVFAGFLDAAIEYSVMNDQHKNLSSLKRDQAFTNLTAKHLEIDPEYHLIIPRGVSHKTNIVSLSRNAPFKVEIAVLEGSASDEIDLPSAEIEKDESGQSLRCRQVLTLVRAALAANEGHADPELELLFTRAVDLVSSPLFDPLISERNSRTETDPKELLARMTPLIRSADGQ